ncbi:MULTISPECIES: protein-disulfide reductase DsbD [unclassified Tatumella]|uniref:protein-disulfide reductase DsbD n=1 Tax=unclassified Tatumella TaxID=2649542 RepID=UPI001BAE6432|nr:MULTISPECIES: protein-disulfide reductase DsbD [unclassified Tatumella]MBS0855477.1 protein-disulfide reductase DsbD [Tatumella sp. JGM16]MBS0912254.1 protein-disulfide reductase DsbD [Tatumella sp. JGM91]
MVARLTRLIFLAVTLFSLQTQAALFDNGSSPRFVTVNQAFGFDFSQNNNRVLLKWQVKSGYYLYRQQISIVAANATIASIDLPQGQPHEDEFFGKSQIFPEDLQVPVILKSTGPAASLKVSYQGCAAAGFCYPPETREIPLSQITADSPSPEPAASVPATASGAGIPSSRLPFSPFWALLIGIGIAFTPCVLPMYPLISAIILGGRRDISASRILLLAFIYVQGMAVTYTLMGIIVAAAGLRFQAALQSPLVLLTLSAVFILLALSMFGLFSLQLPASLQTRLALFSNRQKSGSAGGVFLMGAVAGLICSPCTTAPLSAILLYIAQSGNMLAGGGTLYLYALGMGLPLIIVTLFGNKLLPKSGPWMQSVKEGFGFVILALPVFLIERIVGDVWGLRLWSLLGVAFFGWAFALSLRSPKGWVRILQILWLLLALVAARPLQDWAFSAAPTNNSGDQSPVFHNISNIAGLQQQLSQAQGKITMVDLYADWCVACKEFEKYTFTDPQVRQEFAQYQLVQANVTANTAQDNALLTQLNVLGLPTLLFFNARGNEIPDSRVTGYMNAGEFLAHLQKLRAE